MGYATRDELLAFLNELAGGRARRRADHGADGARQRPTRSMRALMRTIQRDEARWCAMLLKWIAALAGEPSAQTGDFYEKCLAIADVRERIAFINRGQGWVVAKAAQMLPKVATMRMHADSSAMLTSHEENIAEANAALA